MISLLSNTYLVNKLDYFKNTLVLRFHQNDDFDFMINNLMRDFDLFRKTLNNSEIQKDIRDLINFQIKN